jgi:general secretion pathway protein G
MATRAGFTLVEVLIVVVIVAILAAIVIPRVSPTARTARESELRASVHGFRISLLLFRADCGDWPAKLADLVAESGAGLVGGGGDPIPAESFRGPYFFASPSGQVPRDPFTGAADWFYDPATGAVHSVATATSTEGTPYSSW